MVHCRLADVVGQHTRERAQPAGTLEAFYAARRQGPIAVDTRAANTQHYEVPTDFYRHVLGPHLKYSSGWWDAETRTLADAEELIAKAHEAGLRVMVDVVPNHSSSDRDWFQQALEIGRAHA